MSAPSPWAPVDIAGERLLLHAERALFWPRERTLVMADLHLGKGQVFREAGIAVPRGGTADDLERLDLLIATFDPARLLILGDLLHGPLPSDAPWLRQWRNWRARHAAREIVLVAGNHDRAVDAARLALDAALPWLEFGPFRFEHDAHPVNGAFVLGGHLHPVVRMHGRGLKAQFPVLWADTGRAVLPAFSRFTGGWRIAPQPGDRIWLCAPGTVVHSPAAALAGA